MRPEFDFVFDLNQLEIIRENILFKCGLDEQGNPTSQVLDLNVFEIYSFIFKT